MPNLARHTAEAAIGGSASGAHLTGTADGHGAGLSRRVETLTLVHAGVMVIGASWALGGNTEWARLALSVWGSLAIGLVGIACWCQRGGTCQRLNWLWPLVAFDAYVLVSLFNPSFHPVQVGPFTGFVENPWALRWSSLPSTARPDLSGQSLWFLNAAYLTGFNLVLAVRRRRSLRRLLAVLVANSLALAVFGTVQKLAGAKGLYFGAVPTVQPYFFGSFIYHNHWGAFTLLMLASALALLFHVGRRRSARDFWHSPALMVLVCVVFLATTIPLSRSRSSALLAVLLLAAAAAHGLFASIRRRRRFGESPLWPVLGLAGAGTVAAVFIFVLAQPMIAERVANTREQLAEMRQEGAATPRLVLYRDTWHLARERLWLGWGLGAYPTAFYTRNTQYLSHNGPNRVFLDAHSDWLQSVAEVGLVGSVLVAAIVLVPLGAAMAGRRHPIVAYLLAGCLIIVGYATVEFPFGNRAVVVAFWVLFFVAIQYSRLSAKRPAAT